MRTCCCSDKAPPVLAWMQSVMEFTSNSDISGVGSTVLCFGFLIMQQCNVHTREHTVCGKDFKLLFKEFGLVTQSFVPDATRESAPGVMFVILAAQWVAVSVSSTTLM